MKLVQGKVKMGTDETILSAGNRKAMLSTLWIFAMFNYLYCDVLALMNSEYLQQLLTRHVGSIHMSQGYLLGAGTLMEIPASMVLLSRLLMYRANRWANMIAGALMTVVQLSSLFVGSSPTMYYLFFRTIEIVCTGFIVWCAWKWVDPEGNPNTKDHEWHSTDTTALESA